VRVEFGRARQTVIRARDERGCLVVRMNAMFGRAPQEVRDSVARWLRSGRRARRAGAILDEWIEHELDELQRRAPTRVRLRPRGEHHDLEALTAELLRGVLAGEFASADRPGVTWGRAGRSCSRRSLRLGSYDFRAKLVRIHRVLDQPAVPVWFVRYVLFHELLHAALGEDTRGGRRVHHGPQFRRREAAYPDTAAALAWEERHVDALIRSARSGRPLAVPRPVPRPVSGAVPRARVARGWIQRTLFGE
jgi:hypothetical protein